MIRYLSPLFLFACQPVEKFSGIPFEDSRTLEVCELQAEDDFQVDSLSIEGDTLIVNVSYSGGCADHEWQICWDGLTEDIFPPQVYLNIGHNSNGDTCEAIRTETLEFDISSLQEPNPGVGSLTVFVEGETLSYVY